MICVSGCRKCRRKTTKNETTEMHFIQKQRDSLPEDDVKFCWFALKILKQRNYYKRNLQFSSTFL